MLKRARHDACKRPVACFREMIHQNRAQSTTPNDGQTRHRCLLKNANLNSQKSKHKRLKSPQGLYAVSITRTKKPLEIAFKPSSSDFPLLAKDATDQSYHGKRRKTSLLETWSTNFLTKFVRFYRQIRFNNVCQSIKDKFITLCFS